MGKFLFHAKNVVKGMKFRFQGRFHHQEARVVLQRKESKKLSSVSYLICSIKVVGAEVVGVAILRMIWVESCSSIDLHPSSVEVVAVVVYRNDLLVLKAKVSILNIRQLLYSRLSHSSCNTYTMGDQNPCRFCFYQHTLPRYRGGP